MQNATKCMKHKIFRLLWLSSLYNSATGVKLLPHQNPPKKLIVVCENML